MKITNMALALLLTSGVAHAANYEDESRLMHKYMECAAYFKLQASWTKRENMPEYTGVYNKLGDELILKGTAQAKAQKASGDLAFGAFQAYIRVMGEQANTPGMITKLIDTMEARCDGPLKK